MTHVALYIKRACVLCGEDEEFSCDKCKAAVCMVCVRFKNAQILCPSCDDNDEA